MNNVKQKIHLHCLGK